MDGRIGSDGLGWMDVDGLTYTDGWGGQRCMNLVVNFRALWAYLYNGRWNIVPPAWNGHGRTDLVVDLRADMDMDGRGRTNVHGRMGRTRTDGVSHGL